MSTIDRNQFLHAISVANETRPVAEPPPSNGGTQTPKRR